MLHALIAALAQTVLYLLCGDLWVGAALAAGLFAGREHAQAEYRWIERYGEGRRANMPWHGGFQPRVWTLKSALDAILPAVLTAGVALAAGSL